MWRGHETTWKKRGYLASPSEKAMAPHSITLAWKIPWTEEPGGLQSMGSLRVGHNWATSLSLFTFMHWRRKWQPTSVFLPGESQGWGSLIGCRLWVSTESDATEAAWQQQLQQQQQQQPVPRCIPTLSAASTLLCNCMGEPQSGWLTRFLSEILMHQHHER